MLALYALGRPHEALSRYRDVPRCAWTKSSGSSRAGRPGRSSRPSSARRTCTRCCHARSGGRAHRDRQPPTYGSSAARPSSTCSRAASSEGLDDAVLIHVEGEAGLGKSRLLDELTQAARRRASRARELLRARAASALRADRRRAAAGARRGRARRPASPGARPDPPRARALTLRGQSSTRSRFSRRSSRVVADHAPLVLVLDDLQWADPSTLAALAYLRRRGDGLGVAIVTAAVPPEPPGRRPPPGSRARHGRPARAAHRGGARSAWACPICTSRRAGIPVSSPTLVATASRRVPSTDAHRGAARPVPGRGPTGVPACSPPPPSLDQPFDPEPLADLLDADPTELTEELERLCERRILRIDGLRFRFRYDLVRQVLARDHLPRPAAPPAATPRRPAGRRRLQTESQAG